MADVKFIVEENLIIIMIDDLIHLQLMEKPIAIHSYIDEMTRQEDTGETLMGVPLITTIKYNMYYINFHLTNGSVVKCEYNRRDLWEQILKGL